MNLAESKVISEGYRHSHCNHVLESYGLSVDWVVCTDVEPHYKWVRRSDINGAGYRHIQKLDPLRVLILKYQGREICRTYSDGDMIYLVRLICKTHGKK